MITYTVIYSKRHEDEQLFLDRAISYIFNINATKELPLYRDLDRYFVCKGSMAIINEENSEKEVNAMIAKYKKHYNDAVVVSKKAERELFTHAPKQSKKFSLA